MKKIFLFLVLLFCTASYATQVSCATFKETMWNSSDTCLANGNFTIDTSVTIGAFFLPSGQTYTLTNTGTNTVTLTKTGLFWKDSSTGAKTYPNGITHTGASGRMIMSAGSGTITATATVLTYNGIDTLFCQKGATFLGWAVGASGKFTKNSSAGTTNIYSATTPVAMNGNGRLTINRTIGPRLTASGKLISFGANDTLTFNAASIYGEVGANSIIDTIPATLSAGSTGACYYEWDDGGVARSNIQIVVAGNINIPGVFFASRPSAASSNYIFKNPSSNVTCDNMYLGNANATATVWDSLGSGTYTIAQWTPQLSGKSKIALQTATINSSNNWKDSLNDTIYCGTSKINRTGATNTRFYTNGGWAYYDMELKKTSGARDSLAGSGLLCNNLTLTSGSLVQPANFPLLITGNYARTGTTSSDSTFMRGQKTIGGDMTLAAGIPQNVGGDSVLSIFGYNTNSVITLNNNSIGRTRIKKGVASASVSFVDAGRVKTLIDSVGILRFPTTAKTMTVDSILSIDDSVYSAAGHTLQDSGSLIIGANAKPNLLGTIAMVGSAAQTLTNIGKNIGNVTVNKSGAGGITTSGVSRFDTLKILDGTFTSGDTVYCNVFIDSTTDSTVLIAPVIVNNKIIVASGAVIVYSGVGSIAMATCVQATLNGNTVVITYPGGCSFDVAIRNNKFDLGFGFNF